ncbi:hypothetical protein [Streptomyces sp. NWU339]|uniref:hypothetical protein n=1 Tax=Streptomyces sp. NWU339 TaxID=2185284 RepID=UPI00215A3B57|nr:hypothetical protein [Streptomyces sp. NWU339]
MSTEAQRASHPPRPTTPPPPSTPPYPPGRPDDDAREPDRRQPGTGAEETPPGTPAGGPANDTAPVQPKGRTSGGTGAFDMRRPTAPPLAASSPFGPSRSGPSPSGSAPSRPRFPRFDTGGPTADTAGPDGTPPPPQASARFPDTPPTVGRGTPSAGTAPNGSTAVPRQPAHRPTVRQRDTPAETPSETTTRLRPTAAPASVGPTPRTATPPRSAMPPPRPAPDDTWAPAPRPGSPDPVLSWSGPMTPGGSFGPGRPVVSFGPTGAKGYDENARPRLLGQRDRSQIVAAAVCLVLGVGLIGGAVTGSWLAGDSGETASRSGFTAAGSLWHSVPVDQLFPPTVQGKGAGPGDADRLWTRIAVAPDSGCEDAFDPLLRKLLAPLGCERLLRATYTDATQSHVTTVGLLFTQADAAGMASLADRVDRERLDRRTDLVPLPYPAKGTAAADFGAGQRASWAISVLTDAPVVVYAVSGWADGRAVETPQPAEDAMESGATSAPAQAGLGHEAQGLADRVERGLRKNVGTTTEQPS